MGALHILLIDDDRNLATTLSHGIRKALGNMISVAVCFNSSEALSMLTTQTFDLVISDCNMPGMPGLELLKTIRQDRAETRLVLITGYGTDALAEEAHRLGMGYITKPFELPSFMQTIQAVIRGGTKSDRTEAASCLLIGRDDATSGSVCDRVFTQPGIPDV